MQVCIVGEANFRKAYTVEQLYGAWKESAASQTTKYIYLLLREYGWIPELTEVSPFFWNWYFLPEIQSHVCTLLIPGKWYPIL